MKHIFKILLSCMLVFSSCLDIQENYDYEPSNSNYEVGMNAWDFIKSRPDAFSELLEVVRASGIDSTVYSTQNNYTYLLLNNSAVNDLKSLLGTVKESNKQQWINVLNYHIIDGKYHALGTLSFDPIYVVTLWRSQDAVMTLQLENRATFNYSRLVVNGLDPAWTSLSTTYKYAVTSNLMCTNGVSHVLNRYARPISNNEFK